MNKLTTQHINHHCDNLHISRGQLTEFTIPDGIAIIDEGAFEYCTALRSIIIPDGVTWISNRAFSNCTSLESITIPDSVVVILDEAFEDCSALQSITIPNSVTNIRSWAFLGCSSLRSMIIPDSVTTIGFGAIYGCTALTQVICNNPDLFTDHNIHNRDQIQFISTTAYYQDLLSTIKSSGLNTDSLSNRELNLLMRLDQEDYLPNWKTIATTFNERSMDQIRAILKHLNKTIPPKKDILLQKENDKLMTIDGLNGISMFLNPIGYTNLSMTAKDVTFKPQQQK